MYIKNVVPVSSVRLGVFSVLQKYLLFHPLQGVLPYHCQQFLSSESLFSGPESHLTKPEDSHKILLITLCANFQFSLWCSVSHVPLYADLMP